MYCRKCRRRKVDNIQTFEQNKVVYGYVADLEDQYCEECDARERAESCSKAIKADLNIRKARLMAVTEFDQDKFDKLKDKVADYWKKYYTPALDAEKYTFWISRFYSFVDDFLVERVYALGTDKLK